MVHRVIDQIGNGAAQLLLITQHLELLVNGEDQRLFLLAESLRLALHHPQHHRHVDAVIHRQRRRGFNARQRQQLLHQPFHTLSLLSHGVQGFFPRRPLQYLLLHHLQIALQHRQRGAQFMADVGEKVPPRPFQLMHLRHVARHHQPLLIGVRHHANFQMASVIQHQVEWLRKITLFQIVGELGITQEVENILATVVRPAQV